VCGLRPLLKCTGQESINHCLRGKQAQRYNCNELGCSFIFIVRSSSQCADFRTPSSYNMVFICPDLIYLSIALNCWKLGIENKLLAMLATLTCCDDLQGHIENDKVHFAAGTLCRNHVSPSGRSPCSASNCSRCIARPAISSSSGSRTVTLIQSIFGSSSSTAWLANPS